MGFQEGGQQSLGGKICANEQSTSKLSLGGQLRFIGKLNVSEWAGSKVVTPVCAGASQNVENDSRPSYRLLSPSQRVFLLMLS